MTEHEGLERAMRWKDVWAQRELDPERGSLLTQLVAADGYDSNFSTVDEQAWTDYVHSWAGPFGAGPGTSVFEIGCGAGAILYVLHQMGCDVGGIDQSASLLAAARAAIPQGDFAVGDAAEVPVRPQADLVISVGVLFYFPDLDYTTKVVGRMAAKAKHGVLLLDLPDAARREEALAYRIASHGGEQEYFARYSGLDHLHFERPWIRDVMAEAGLQDVEVVDQSFTGYGNAPFRFNAWGRVGDRSRAQG
jgi:SAM-dependent methyltransferase